MEWFPSIVNLALEAVTDATFSVLVALFVVAALTEVGMPFPFVIDTVLFYIGYNTGTIPLRVLAILLALFLGRVLGSGIIYALARLVGRPFVRWLTRRFPRIGGRLDGLKARLVGGTRGSGRIKAFGPEIMAGTTVCILRLTPGLLTGVTVASGLIHLRFDVFVFGVLLASLAADGALLVSGLLAALGIQWIGIAPSWWVFLIALVVLMGLFWALQHYFTKRRDSRSNS
jgi:membrane protein DedA with SNARE-associated domain